MKQNHRRKSQPAPLWHEEIHQDVQHSGWTPAARRRTLVTALHTLGWSAVLALVAWGVFIGINEINQVGRPGMRTSGEPLPMRKLVVQADGFLDSEWVRNVLALRDGTDLLALDLDALRGRLEAEGQVRTATLRCNFPDTLEVHIMERSPVARLRTSSQQGTEEMLVDREGVVYSGHNYDEALVRALPYLGGVRLKRSTEGGILPVEGMPAVARMLDQAGEAAPHLVRRWRVLSLENLPRISIRAEDVREIVIDSSDLSRQLARLDHIIDHNRQHGTGTLDRIDLTLGAQVPVTIAQDSPLRSFAQTAPGERRVTSAN